MDNMLLLHLELYRSLDHWPPSYLKLMTKEDLDSLIDALALDTPSFASVYVRIREKYDIIYDTFLREQRGSQPRASCSNGAD